MLLLLLCQALAATAHPRGLGAQPPPSAAPLATGASTSGLWPRLGTASASGTVPLLLSPGVFAFTSPAAAASPRLQRALARYLAVVMEQKTLWRDAAPSRTLPLRALEVVVAAGGLDAPPQLHDDESFSLLVSPAQAVLRARTFSGVHRGLEAFAQLTVNVGGAIIINSTSTTVAGRPLFPYRGLMVDTGRHFQPVPQLLQVLDGMAASGLNVFHWHLTDAQSFPWNATAEPRLVAGAYRSDLVYQRADLEAVVAFAADRAIRVVPEIDVPGHAAAFAVGRPDVVVDCKPDDSAPNYDGSYQSASQLDPSQPATYTLLGSLVSELAAIFPDDFIHFGGV